MTQATPVRDLSLSQLASVFNSMPGKPVNKFSSAVPTPSAACSPASESAAA
jgi:hypothetical protein